MFQHLHHGLNSVEVKPNVFIINKSAQDQTVKHRFDFQASHPAPASAQEIGPGIPPGARPPLQLLCRCLQAVHLPFQARQATKVRCPYVSVGSGVPPFSKVRVKPLGFHKRPSRVPVSTDHKKSEEDFCFDAQRCKVKIAFRICLQ